KQEITKIILLLLLAMPMKGLRRNDDARS
ncbi:MAG: hypothetical protein JWQ40_2195, partial [Segetibacter sp.]|nr:hypothetical protein [Segetibacter sp.]